ncbi:N-6 DNA methylase [bacterium]|nr:N-6 DNA methylase [bacterium]
MGARRDMELAHAEEAVAAGSRHLGAHYTPTPIVRRMVRAALGPLVDGRGPEEILQLRILDPAVGSGRFLREALDVLAAATGRPEVHRAEIAATCLYGADIHEPAVRLARNVLTSDARLPADGMDGNLVVADSLLESLSDRLGIEKFHAIVMNPPWISYSGRQARELSAERRKALSTRYEAFARWPTEHGAFLELAASLLAKGGRAAVLVPEQVTHLQGYEATRRALRRRCTLDPPPESLGEREFRSVVQATAIVHLRQGVAPEAPAVVTGDPVARILARMREQPCARQGTFSDCGVHTGNSASLLVHDEAGSGREPVREGRQVHPFALDPPSRWLTPSPNLPYGRYCRVGSALTYRTVRIVLRQTANRPIAARHVEPTYFRNSILACSGIAGTDDAELVALLNSSAVGFYHRHSQADGRQQTFPQVKVGHLASLPIPRSLSGLAMVAQTLETLAGRQSAARAHLVWELAGLLACTPGRLTTGRGVEGLARARDLRAALVRRAPRAEPRLKEGGLLKKIESALAAYRDATAPLGDEIDRAMAELDEAVCGLYGLSHRDVHVLCESAR